VELTKITAYRMLAELNLALGRADPLTLESYPFVHGPLKSNDKVVIGITTKLLWTKTHNRAFEDVCSTYELDDQPESGS